MNSLSRRIPLPMHPCLASVRPRAGSLCFASLLWAAQVNCSPDAPSSRGATVRDSAGIQIIESASPAWREGGGWRVGPEPAVEIGADVNDPTQYLYSAYDVERLEDGRLVVENRGTSQLLVFDSVGSFVEAVGRNGEGPGEFGMMRGLYRCTADTLVADGVNRVSLFDAQLSFVRTAHTRRYPGDSNPGIKGVAPDCSAVLVEDAHRPSGSPRGVYAVSHFLYWEVTESGERDTVAVFPGTEAVDISYSGQTLPQAVLWGKETVWAASGDTVYLGMSDTPEIRVVDRRGTVRRLIRWAAEPAPVTAADRARFAERRRERLRERPREVTIFPPLDRFPVPDRKPLYSKIVVDDEGNLWLRGYPESAVGWPHVFYPEASDPPEEWEVFDPAGRWLGTVEIPAALEVLEIQDGYVIGHWLDELEVERIRLHRIDKT